MADKVIELLRLMEKFGVKPGKIIGAGDRKVTPIKKPILTKQLNRDYIDQDVKDGKIGTNTVKNEIEDVASLFFQKKLNDVEVNNLLNNLTYLDNALNPTNVVDLATKKPIVGEGLETLKEAEGLIAPPTTTVGRIQSKLNEAKRGLQDISGEPDLADLIKGAGKEQLSYNKMHNEGLVRAVARSILYEDIKAGKIKGMTLEQLGSAKDPIQDFRKIYGESALEQLDSLTPEFNQMYTPQEGATLARKKFTLTPDETRLPGSQTYEELEKIKKGEVVDMTYEVDKRKTIDELIDEYNSNQDKLSLTDEQGDTAITYTEFNELKDRNKKIADALEEKGIKSTPEVEEKPEGIVIPFRKKITEPEEFADGGITRTKFATGGKGKKILDIIKKANKDLKNKKSMETVNPKTGEVTVADEFVTTSEQQLNKKRQLTREEIEDYEEQLGDSETWMSEGTVEEAENALKKSKAEEAYYLQQYKTGQLDPPPGEKSQSRMRFLQKKAEEAADVKDKRLFSLDESDELDELERTFNKKNTSTEGFDFNDPEIKAQMEKAMQEGNKRSKEMRAMGLDPAKSKDYDEYIKIKEKSGDKNFNKYFDDLEIKTKFKGVISDDLLNQILIDDNPQRKAEVIATIEQGLKMQEKGMDPQEIVDILKNTTRTKQAKGGSVGLNYLMGF
jgi:hypothetical protein